MKRTIREEAAEVLLAAEKFLCVALEAVGSETRRQWLRRGIGKGLNAAYWGLDTGGIFQEDDTPTKPHPWASSPYSTNKELWLNLWRKNERTVLFDAAYYYQAALSYGTKNPSKKYASWFDAAANWASREHQNRKARYADGTRPVSKKESKLDDLGL